MLSYQVGIPRALLYYNYMTLWQTFFSCLDIKTVVSDATNKDILDQGAARVADEACLPVKIYFGHAASLLGMKPDFLFVPRIVSVERKAFICPKIMGLPDMLAASRLPLPKLLMPTLDLNSQKNPAQFLREIGSMLGCCGRKLKRAWQEAEEEQRRYENMRIKENVIQGSQQSVGDAGGQTTILILGHNYNLYDSFLNMNLQAKIKACGCHLITPDQIPHDWIETEVKDLPKKIFWTFGKTILGSARWFRNLPEPKGAVLLTSFGCGIDSFIGNMVLRTLRRANIPCLSITLDEHTGEAGLNTRLEAFIDMLGWRRRFDENHLSPHGIYLDTAKDHVGNDRINSRRAAADH